MVRGVRMTRGTIEGGTTISLAGVEGASEDRPREIGLQTPAFHSHILLSLSRTNKHHGTFRTSSPFTQTIGQAVKCWFCLELGRQW